MTKSKRPPKEVLERMYHDERMTQWQIAQEFDVHQGAVGRWLSRCGISTIGHGGPINGSRVPMPPKDVLKRMYNDENMTQYQIEKEFNVGHGTVGNWLSHYGIQTIVPMPPKEEIKKLINEGLNQNQIAEHFKVHDSTIFRWCECLDIPGMVNGFRCHTDEHINWKHDIFKRDNRTCQMCNATNTRIEAHHIIPHRDHPELAYKLDNGITLCEQCHLSIRGREYNYSKQFLIITQPQFYIDEIAEIFDRKGVEIFGGEMPDNSLIGEPTCLSL